MRKLLKKIILWALADAIPSAPDVAGELDRLAAKLNE